MPAENGSVGCSEGGTDEAHLIDATGEHAIFALDSAGIIRSWSSPATAMYGYEADAVVGRHLRLLFDDSADLDRPLGVVLAQATDGPVGLDATHARADGDSFPARTVVSPLPGEDESGYAVVCEDTTDSKRYERTLERQNDRLKEFTDILVHDLRNPLHVIHQRLALYQETGDDAHLDSLSETVDRMERLVDDLLRVARQGNVVTDREPIDVAEIVDRAWEGVESGSATLAYDPVPTIRADADRLIELFENLFRNAVEHGGPAPTVRVGPLEDGVFVEDDGPGIDPDSDDRIFDHGYTTTDDGSGYGLSVVRTIVNAHGWDVVATQSAAGGARFEVNGIDH